MIKKLFALVIPLVALIGGVAAGDMLKPQSKAEPAADEASHAAEAGSHEAKEESHGSEGDGHGTEEEPSKAAWFTFPNQFFVPMMREGDMGAVMILTLSIETKEDALEAIKLEEHRLRDALLRQLMIRANSGGFDGNFTSESVLGSLRDDLLAAADQATELPVFAVLIEDIARQEG